MRDYSVTPFRANPATSALRPKADIRLQRGICRCGPLNETARAVERCAQGVVKTEASTAGGTVSLRCAPSDTPWMMAVTVRFAGVRLRPEIGRIALLVSTPYRFVILTSSVKRFRLIDREIFIILRGLVCAMRLKALATAHRVIVVKCAIFTTPNSLKSQGAQNIKSPFRNDRAITSKLYSRLSPT